MVIFAIRENAANMNMQHIEVNKQMIQSCYFTYTKHTFSLLRCLCSETTPECSSVEISCFMSHPDLFDHGGKAVIKKHQIDEGGQIMKL